MNLKLLIKKLLLSESKKKVFFAQPTVTYTMDFRYTSHSEYRKVRPELVNYDQRPITREEVFIFLEYISPNIANSLMSMDIKDGIPFVVKSIKWSLAMPIIPYHEGGLYWRFMVSTVFRETLEYPFRTGKDQFIINV
jgi:hypothetical protein